MGGSSIQSFFAASRHSKAQALLGSTACVAAVTGAIYAFRGAVPVLSLGALYLFAVLPVAVLCQEYVDLAGLMGVKGWKLTFKVILPAISPYVFTGIRTSIPFAVIGAIVGEFVAATEGIGFFIRMSAGIFKTADVFVGIIVLMIMVIIIDRIAELIERRALRWQSQTEHIRIQA